MNLLDICQQCCAYGDITEQIEAEGHTETDFTCPRCSTQWKCWGYS